MDTALALQLLATSCILWVAAGAASDYEWWSRDNYKLGYLLKDWTAFLFVVFIINAIWSY